MKRKLLVFLIAIMLLVSLTSCSSTNEKSEATIENTTTRTTIETTTTEKEKLLELLDYRCIREHGFIIVRGNVKNISNSRLEDILAIVYYSGENDEFIKFAEALIEYNPIMPNQISPFEVITTDNPLIAKYVVFFQFMSGEIIIPVFDY